ncbi:putative phage abortive infection protein [Microbulbifer sp. CnH-101-G]|uniref:putative phage abortive infection protein n=1 Tax=Microbulbifer sp. CnH-101-G TaxID=3243393 RepID=UPI004039069C
MKVHANQIDTSPKWRSLIRDFKRLIAISLIIAVCAGLMYAFTFRGGLSTDNGDWGTFGDFMGGVLNPIFGFAGLMALLLTISMQSEELNNSTRELRNSAEALKEQGESLKKQNFENTFFQLIKLHNDIVNDIDLVGLNNKQTRGRDCFRVFYERLRAVYNNKWDMGISERDKIRISFERVYHKSEGDLGHYFRNLYSLLRFVDERGKSKEDKQFYARIIRSQLSVYETGMLFYSGLYGKGKDKFKPLAEQHALFDNLDSSILLNGDNHRDIYAAGAFSNREAGTTNSSSSSVNAACDTAQ